MQLDLLDILKPPPEPLPAYVPPVRRPIMTRAYGVDTILNVGEEDFDPFEIEVRGVTTIIRHGFCTYTVEKPGSPYWSETGFRSFRFNTSDPAEITEAIERYIDAPAKDGNGCGGVLTKWWPSYVLHWRQSLGFELTMTKALKGSENIWDQWGPEKWAEHWASHDAQLAEQFAQMIADGIDPNDVGPTSHFRGKWPRFDMERLPA